MKPSPVRRSVLSAAALALILAMPGARASAQPVVPAAEPVVVLDSVMWRVTAKSNGQAYRVYISRPAAPPPPEGYPVFYMLDGDGYFGIGASQMRMRGGSELRPALVVAIGSASDDMKQIVPDRWRDFSPSQPVGDDVTALLKAGFVIPAYGGAEAFHKFLVDELRPMLAAAYKIDQTDQSLFGHSMGGLFVVHELINHPTSFRTFVAASPSLYWGGGAVQQGLPAFASRVKDGAIAPRVLLTVGGDEFGPSKVNAPPGPSRDEFLRMLREKAMVDNVKRLGATLAGLRGAAGYTTETIVFPDESHTSVTPIAVSRGMSFALGRQSPARKP